MDLRDLLRNAIAEADRIAQRDGHLRTGLKFGGIGVTIRLDDRGPLRRLLPMMGTCVADNAQPTALIDVVGALDGHTALLPPMDRRDTMLLRATDDIYYLWLNEATGYLTAIDRTANRGLVWFTAPDQIASWHVARPLLHAIKGLSLKTPWTPVHAASVALNGHGVLIVGQSGSGKTSAAISCALRGWDYLGDDAVIVRSDPCRVAPLYNSARLRADTFELFPEAMTASLGISDDSGEDKAEVDMAMLRPLTGADAEIRALVFPAPTDWTEFHIHPLSRTEALRRMMIAARQSIVGDEAASFDKLATIVRDVPCYTLVNGGDRGQLSDALAQLVK
jgi:hypothetical protein